MIVVNIILTIITSVIIIASLYAIKKADENTEIIMWVMIAIYEVAMLLKIWD